MLDPHYPEGWRRWCRGAELWTALTPDRFREPLSHPHILPTAPTEVPASHRFVIRNPRIGSSLAALELKCLVAHNPVTNKVVDFVAPIIGSVECINFYPMSVLPATLCQRFDPFSHMQVASRTVVSGRKKRSCPDRGRSWRLGMSRAGDCQGRQSHQY
jgi:hypothetical protein